MELQPHERAVLAAAQEKAAAEGIPLREALRTFGHTPAEFVAQRAAMMDVQDAREEFTRARRLRELEAAERAYVGTRPHRGRTRRRRWLSGLSGSPR